MEEGELASSPKGKTGLRRIWNALLYSIDGIKAALRHEAGFRQEVLLALVLIPLALVLSVGGIGKALMIGSIFLVLVTELMNSGVEAAIDRISPERHELSKRAKDLGSAAVFISLMNVVVVWVLVLFG
jgi:diacylglycerol kinase (ATP)